MALIFSYIENTSWYVRIYNTDKCIVCKGKKHLTVLEKAFLVIEGYWTNWPQIFLCAICVEHCYDLFNSKDLLQKNCLFTLQPIFTLLNKAALMRNK